MQTIRLRFGAMAGQASTRAGFRPCSISAGILSPAAIAEIEKTLLALPLEQRVLLAESLLSSLPPLGEEWSEAQELAEVERREGEIESGQVQPLSEVEFWRRVEAGRKR